MALSVLFKARSDTCNTATIIGNTDFAKEITFKKQTNWEDRRVSYRNYQLDYTG